MGTLHRILNWLRNRLFFLQSSSKVGFEWPVQENVPNNQETGSVFPVKKGVSHFWGMRSIKSCWRLGRCLPRKPKYNRTGKRESKKS